jgi:hypothetical protein
MAFAQPLRYLLAIDAVDENFCSLRLLTND